MFSRLNKNNYASLQQTVIPKESTAQDVIYAIENNDTSTGFFQRLQECYTTARYIHKSVIPTPKCLPP